MIMNENTLPVGTVVTIDCAGHPDHGKRGVVVEVTRSGAFNFRRVRLDGENTEPRAWDVSCLWADAAHAVDPVIPYATGKLGTVSPRSYRVARFPRVTVVLWNAREGAWSIDGVHAVYVNSDQTVMTLVRGRYGDAVRLTVADNVVSIIETATGAAAASHPIDDASSLLSIAAHG
jgi:hypothetical protein